MHFENTNSCGIVDLHNFIDLISVWKICFYRRCYGCHIGKYIIIIIVIYYL